MSRRFWFVSLSVAAHLGLGFGVFATGIWNVERLDRDDRPLTALAVFMPDTAAPAGGGLQLKAQELKPKPKTPVKGPTQAVTDTKPDPNAATTPSTGIGPGDGPGTGTGDKDSTGTCLVEPCGEVKKDPEPEPVKPVEKPVVQQKDILPNELSLMRTSGNPQIHPSDVTKNQMLHEGKDRTSGIVKICVNETGMISSVTLLKSTKYPAYDALLLQGARGWTYKPYTTAGRTLKVCGTVTFQYAIK